MYCVPFHPSDLGPSLCHRLVCVFYRMARSPPRAMHGRFRFTAACKSHWFLKPRSVSKRRAPPHLIVALATCMIKHSMNPATLPDIEFRTRKCAFARLARGPSMLVKAKSLRLVTPRETPLTSPCSIEGRFRTSARLIKIVRISLSSLESHFSPVVAQQARFRALRALRALLFF